MNFLFEVFPLLLFFAAFKFADIFVATGIAMAASVLQILWLVFRKKEIKAMMWVNLLIISVFGGLTIWLQDEAFIKWKPSILYWGFAVGLLISRLAMKKNLIKSMMAKEIALPEAVWQHLHSAWVLFFVAMGFANLLIAFALGLSTETWVSFKVFGGMGLMLIFVVAQGVWLSPYLKDNQTK